MEPRHRALARARRATPRRAYIATRSPYGVGNSERRSGHGGGLVSEQLKPCPFCGADARTHGDRDVGYYVTCDSDFCRVALGENYDRSAPNHDFAIEADAIAAWN